MTQFKSEFMQVLHERGFVHQISDVAALDEKFATEIVTGYIGFDPTASSLHVGGLMQIMLLHWMQKTGHRPIALMGGGTGMIGDPSFKDEARKLLTVKDIEANIAGIKKVFANFLDFHDGDNGALMVNNGDWLLELSYIEFLRDVGRHFSVNRMLSFDSVKTRLEREQSLSFLEFNYMILQAYDFVELNKRYGAILQMGGSDQWGNIINGVDLGHRMLDEQFYAITSPLLTTSSGQKMGKTANGAVWLNEDMLSVYDFWQYWRNTEDADVERFFKLYTTLPLAEISHIIENSDINEAKKILATEITALVHSRVKAEEASNTAVAVFEAGKLDLSLPTIQIGFTALDGGLGILAATVTAGLASSNGEVRRHIQAGGLRINDIPVVDEKRTLTREDILEEGVIKLSLGKKKHILLKAV